MEFNFLFSVALDFLWKMQRKPFIHHVVVAAELHGKRKYSTNLGTKKLRKNVLAIQSLFFSLIRKEAGSSTSKVNE